MNRKLLVTAIATAMCAPALAAFDDQGMEYISASEGLSGSMRIDIFKHDNDDSSQESRLDSLRIYYTGSADLGGGLRSTYYWELRENSDDGPDGNVHTEAFDLGLTGPFGAFSVGRLGGVAPRLVPGGSLDAATGNEHASYSPDPGPNGLRYESADFNGFQFGLSAQLQERAGDDPAVDGFNAALKYVHPTGLQLGFGYESSACWNATLGVKCSEVLSAALDDLVEDGLTTQQRALVATAIDGTVPTYGDRGGFRIGARYGQDDWLLSYEYRAHDNFDGNLSEGTEGDKYGMIVGDFPGDGSVALVPAADPVDATLIPNFLERGDGYYDFQDGTSYEVHRMAFQFKFEKLTFSANYSIEETEITDDFTLVGGGLLNLSEKRTFGRDKIGVDVSYALGSKSSIILGWFSTESEVGNDTVVFGDLTTLADDEVTQRKTTREDSETLIRYRVDF